MPNLDSRARRLARKAGFVARKSRWRRDSCDNFGEFMLIEPAGCENASNGDPVKM
jgi:hypothetical protein